MKYMNGYEASFGELRGILGRLSRLLDVTITFFDIQSHELKKLNVKGRSPFCTLSRKSAAFDRACRACDARHLEEAKEQRGNLIYHCHCGLIEGIVPLYSRDGLYLGAIMFGQLRDLAASAPENVSAGAREIWNALEGCTVQRARDIGDLLKDVSEHIIQQELIRVRHEVWAETLQRYIEEHLAERITLDDLGRLIGRSASFVAHHFASEFGKTPRQYILERKMEYARQLLEEGLQVQQTAERLGFYDAFHFSRQFRRYWKCPPSAFKFQCR